MALFSNGQQPSALGQLQQLLASIPKDGMRAGDSSMQNEGQGQTPNIAPAPANNQPSGGILGNYLGNAIAGAPQQLPWQQPGNGTSGPQLPWQQTNPGSAWNPTASFGSNMGNQAKSALQYLQGMV